MCNILGIGDGFFDTSSVAEIWFEVRILHGHLRFSLDYYNTACVDFHVVEA